MNNELQKIWHGAEIIPAPEYKEKTIKYDNGETEVIKEPVRGGVFFLLEYKDIKTGDIIDNVMDAFTANQLKEDKGLEILRVAQVKEIVATDEYKNLVATIRGEMMKVDKAFGFRSVNESAVIKIACKETLNLHYNDRKQKEANNDL